MADKKTNVITIRSEMDAFRYLQLAIDNQIGVIDGIKFDGWPNLNLYLKGKKFDQSLTPTVMKGLIEFQKGIYQSYAIAKFNNPTKRLTKQERDDLELEVKVEKGSSDIDINFQDIAEKFVEHLADKMDATHVLILVLSVALMYFGSSTIKSWFENQKEIKLAELKDEEAKAQLESMQFISEQETERMRVITNAMRVEPRIQNISETSAEAKSELLRSMGNAQVAKFSTVELSKDEVDLLSTNVRRESKEIRLDGLYRILKLDWSNQLSLKVKVWNVDNGISFDAKVQDETLTGAYKEAIQQAEWQRQPVKLQINARLLGDDEYKEAIIMHAELPTEEQTRTN